MKYLFLLLTLVLLVGCSVDPQTACSKKSFKSCDGDCGVCKIGDNYSCNTVEKCGAYLLKKTKYKCTDTCEYVSEKINACLTDCDSLIGRTKDQCYTSCKQNDNVQGICLDDNCFIKANDDISEMVYNG